MRDYPAIEIRFTAQSHHDVGLPDRLLAALDDFHPTAIEESADAQRVFFESAAARDRALAWMRAAEPTVTVSSVDVPDEDWARRSQANLGPVRVGRIIVTPPWSVEQARAAASANAGDVVIVIVPSTGFGTGHHASTRLCLALLQETPIDGRSVLDIGTGSAVLAIAAASLGAASVAALDNDPDAIETARENIGLNQVRTEIVAVVEDLRRASRQAADVVLANLTGELLCRAAADIARLTTARGRCIVSGVMNHEQERVADALAAVGLELAKTVAEDEWVGMLFEKR